MFLIRYFKPLFAPVYVIYAILGVFLFGAGFTGIISYLSQHQKLLQAVLVLVFIACHYQLAIQPWITAVRGFWRGVHRLHPLDLVYLHLFPIHWNKFLVIESSIRYTWVSIYISVVGVVWAKTSVVWHIHPRSPAVILCIISWISSSLGAGVAAQWNFERAFDLKTIFGRICAMIAMVLGGILPIMLLVASPVHVLMIATFISLLGMLGALWLEKIRSGDFVQANLQRMIEDANQKRAHFLARILKMDMKRIKPIPKWRKKIPLPTGRWGFGWRYNRLVVRVPGYFRYQLRLFFMVSFMVFQVFRGHRLPPLYGQMINPEEMSILIGGLLSFIAGTLVCSWMYVLNWRDDFSSTPWLELFPMPLKNLIHQLKSGPLLFAEIQGAIYWLIAAWFLFPTFGSDWATRILVSLLGIVVACLLAKHVVHQAVCQMVNPKWLISPLFFIVLPWGYVAFLISRGNWLDTFISWTVSLVFVDCFYVLKGRSVEVIRRIFSNNL